MDIIVAYDWQIFIVIEGLSLIFIFLFGLFRYYFDKRKVSQMFFALFMLFSLVEALLGLYVYNLTGEISTFLIIIIVFLVYAATFGIVDFIRLDRWMHEKIGKFCGVDLLIEKDKQIMIRNI